MKKQTLEILHRYRKHLLEREQIIVQEKIAEEDVQKARLLQLRVRIHDTHEAKLTATTPDELCTLDDAAAYLHGRTTLAQRALHLARTAREEAVERTIRAKQESDQVGLLLEKGRLRLQHEHDQSEQAQMNDLATARYAMTTGRL